MIKSFPTPAALLILFIVFSIFFSTIASAQEVTLLQPFNIDTETLSGDTAAQTYLVAAFDLLIKAAGVMAVIMIIVGGFQYIGSSVSPSAKSDAKDRILKALLGLAIILASYLILSTINPDLIKFEFDPGKLQVDPNNGPLQPAPAFGTGTEPAPASETPAQTAARLENASRSLITFIEECPDCVEIPPELSAKTTAENGCFSSSTTENCQISSNLADKLIVFDSENMGSLDYQITEMWPPTQRHLNSCHANGTCVDIALRNNRNAAGDVPKEDVEAAITSFRTAGLNPVYETSNQALVTAINNNQGLGSATFIPNIQPHFSVYQPE